MTAIEGDTVTLDTTEVLTGEVGETVQVTAPAGLAASLGTIDFQVGGSYLVPPSTTSCRSATPDRRTASSVRRSTRRSSTERAGSPSRCRGRLSHGPSQGAGARRRRGVLAPARGGDLHDGGCNGVTVVLGAGADEAVRLLDGLGVDVVVAHDWAEGMSASLRSGLESLTGSDAQAAVVSLVDLPDLTAAVVRRVLSEREGDEALVRASYHGRPGHPVVLGRAHWQRVAGVANGDAGARDYLASNGAVLVECGDLASGVDVDRRSSAVG